jgi:hypothetical protein
VNRADLAGMEERILLAIATASEVIAGAVRESGAAQIASLEAMTDRILERGSLRAARSDRYVHGPTTPPGGPANDDDTPPPASTPRPAA